MTKKSLETLLAEGRPIDAGGMVTDEMIGSTHVLMAGLKELLDAIDPQELQTFQEIAANNPKPAIDGVNPHQSTARGWDPATRTGLRLPNRPNPKQQSPVIAFQIAEAHLAASKVADERLQELREQACKLGEQVLEAARNFPPLSGYASHFASYETRVNANLAPEQSPLWPQVTPKGGYLHAPHQDRSVATVGLGATGEGFVYYDFAERRFKQELPTNYIFLGKDNGEDATACLHAVERVRPPEAQAVPVTTQFGIGRTSVVVFLQGEKFANG